MGVGSGGGTAIAALLVKPSSVVDVKRVALRFKGMGCLGMGKACLGLSQRPEMYILSVEEAHRDDGRHCSRNVWLDLIELEVEGVNWRCVPLLSPKP